MLTDILGLPVGAPLHLERPGRALELFKGFLEPERLERLRTTLARRTRHLTVVADSFHDGHNIAACVRSCEAFGIQDLHLIPQPEIKKQKRLSMMVSTGAHKWLSIVRHKSPGAAGEALHAAGYAIVIAEPLKGRGCLSVDELSLDRPVALVLGNEHDGVSAALRDQADAWTHIPTRGFVESLNVSVACAIAVSRLRSRMDTELGPEALLNADEQVALLDLWVARDVPRVRQVVQELIHRESGC